MVELSGNTVPGITEKEFQNINNYIRQSIDSGSYYLLKGGSVDAADAKFGNPKITTNVVMRYAGFFGNGADKGPNWIKKFKQSHPAISDDEIYDLWGNYLHNLSSYYIEGDRYIASPSFRSVLLDYAKQKANATTTTPYRPDLSPRRSNNARPESTNKAEEDGSLAVVGCAGILIILVIIYFIFIR